MFQIVRREQFSDQTFLWEIDAPDVARAAQPGHFVMLRLDESGERIPLTVADFDRERGTVTVVVQTLGKTTREMRDSYAQGDSFADFVGPLGLAQHVGKVGHVVLVGGGLGVAPVFPQLRAFKQAGNRTTCIVGFRNSERMFWTDRLAQWSDELILCTDDGSAGRSGFVHSALQDLLEREKPDLVVAIGPMPMMQACAETSRPSATKTMVSPQLDHGRRHRHVRLLPRDRGRRRQVRLRRRPRLRRAPGRLQGTACAPEALQGPGEAGQRRP